jgi:hypothetical protein
MFSTVKKPDVLFLFLKNIDAVSIFKYIDAMLLNLDPDIVRSGPRLHSVDNMAEVPVPQQTKKKFVNLSVFKNFIKFQN